LGEKNISNQGDRKSKREKFYNLGGGEGIVVKRSQTRRQEVGKGDKNYRGGGLASNRSKDERPLPVQTEGIGGGRI